MPDFTDEPEDGDVLVQLLDQARPSVLRSIIMLLVDSGGPQLRQKCLGYLKDYFPDVIAGREDAVADEEAITRWWSLEPDLEQLHQLGGGPYEQEYRVACQLDDLSEHLGNNGVSSQARETLRDEVLGYIEDRNSGMDDCLYEVAFATCYTDDDLRALARRFEQLDSWSRQRAMRTYRQIGDDEQYLRLRCARLNYGSDYLDLAEFYQERGDEKQAVRLVQEGLEKGKGALDGLRSFLAQQARESGDRQQYLQLEFTRLAAQPLTLKRYRDFRKLCSGVEWQEYESRILQLVSEARRADQIRIHLERGDLHRAAQLFDECSFLAGSFSLGDSHLLEIADTLQPHFPEQVLDFYMKGLRRVGITAPRGEYAAQADILLKIRHLMLNILGNRPRWEELAGRIKRDNERKPAFQEEFARIIPDWRRLR